MRKKPRNHPIVLKENLKLYQTTTFFGGLCVVAIIFIRTVGFVAAIWGLALGVPEDVMEAIRGYLNKLRV